MPINGVKCDYHCQMKEANLSQVDGKPSSIRQISSRYSSWTVPCETRRKVTLRVWYEESYDRLACKIHRNLRQDDTKSRNYVAVQQSFQKDIQNLQTI